MICGYYLLGRYIAVYYPYNLTISPALLLVVRVNTSNYLILRLPSGRNPITLGGTGVPYSLIKKLSRLSSTSTQRNSKNPSSPTYLRSLPPIYTLFTSRTPNMDGIAPPPGPPPPKVPEGYVYTILAHSRNRLLTRNQLESPMERAIQRMVDLPSPYFQLIPCE